MAPQANIKHLIWWQILVYRYPAWNQVVGSSSLSGRAIFQWSIPVTSFDVGSAVHGR